LAPSAVPWHKKPLKGGEVRPISGSAKKDGRKLVRIVEIVDKVEKVLISVLFSLMVLAVFSQVVNRNLLKLEIGWFEEVARGCMVYVLMFATEIGLRDHSQLNIDSLTRRLPARAANVLQHISDVVTIIFAGAVGFSSIQILQAQFQSKATTPGLGIPTYIAQASVTIGCILIFVTQIVILLNLFLGKKREGDQT